MANQKIFWYGKEVEKVINSNALKSVLKACKIVKGDVQRSMKPGHGREYPRGKKIHRASAPGEPPAVDYGRLRASISVNWKDSGLESGEVGGKAKQDDGIGKPDTELTGRVGTRVEYAEDLETGNEERNLEPRPYLRPALERYRNKYQNEFKDIVK